MRSNVTLRPPNPLTEIERGYHHGALRDALVNAGMQLLENSDAENLSMREVARSVGVSPTAVYRHFVDKDAFLKALASEGLERLGIVQVHAATNAGYGIGGFNASGRAYVYFALAHPTLFRLILSRAPSVDLFAADEDETPGPMRFLRTHVRALAPKGTPKETLRILATRAWSQVHGLAMLILDGQMPNDSELIDAAVDGRGIFGDQPVRT
jgi:AcrR family transcriptional regulator